MKRAIFFLLSLLSLLLFLFLVVFSILSIRTPQWMTLQRWPDTNVIDNNMILCEKDIELSAGHGSITYFHLLGDYQPSPKIPLKPWRFEYHPTPANPYGTPFVDQLPTRFFFSPWRTTSSSGGSNVQERRMCASVDRIAGDGGVAVGVDLHVCEETPKNRKRDVPEMRLRSSRHAGEMPGMRNGDIRRGSTRMTRIRCLKSAFIRVIRVHPRQK